MNRFALALSTAAMVAGGAVSAQTSLARPPDSSAATSQEDPRAQLEVIDNRFQVRKSLLPSPIQAARDRFSERKKRLYDSTGLNLGFSFHTVYQYADEVQPGFDDDGWATDFDIVGTWEVLNRGQPNQGQFFFGLEGRWNYNTTGPQTLGLANIGAAGGSANSFEEYTPTFILRNLYWEQGSPDAGWQYRLGKITIDAILGTSRHLSPNATFLSNAGTGLFVNAYADSALGAVGTYFFNDAKGYVRAAAVDANGDRFDFGNITDGNFYTALELGYKAFPRTDGAGYSKLTLWHTDGTTDGAPINANTGADGWGYSILVEQELDKDGDIFFVGRWGESNDKAAIYDYQGSAALLFYQPFGWFDSDALGIQYNYIDPAGAESRIEETIEVFYRFPLLPEVETTIAYQYIDNPGNTRLVDSSNVFSLRLTTSF